jgi:flagellar basal-body rod protein FlgF
MDRLIYTAMSGANAAASRQAVLSNNLANASTNGFRAELSTYRAVPLRGEGATTRVFALEATAGYMDKPGPAQRTDRALDAMTSGNSWFAVQGLDGTEAYTRNGHFEVSPQGVHGQLETGCPCCPMVERRSMCRPGATVSIGHDGSISAKVGTQPANVIARLKMATPTGEDPLQRGEDGLFRATSGDPLNNDNAARLHVGSLEGLQRQHH